MDDTVKTPEQVTELLSLPILGAIVKFGRATNKNQNRRLIAFDDPSSPISESYRQLRTNLFFSSEERQTKVYVITSPGPEEGKSVTAANLAVVMAAAGRRVLLVDADMRRPVQHQIFGLENEVGLTTLLAADPRDDQAPQHLLRGSGGYAACLNDTEVPNLRVITSGFLPANPSEVLGTVMMQRWAKLFKNASNVDVVIFDTPPLLVVSDSTILAAATDAETIMILRAGKTRRTAAVKARAQLEQLGLTVNGVVLNQVTMRDLGGDYGYGYGYGYYYSSDKPTNKSANEKVNGRSIQHNKA
ncbi:CpsD/CapB family tyrosine-protein kinase [Chloroflexota bacterium]